MSLLDVDITTLPARAKAAVKASRSFLLMKGEDAAASGTLNLGGREVRYQAVFDGHGGRLGSQYCATHMAKCIVAHYEVGSGPHVRRMERALHKAFLEMDSDIRAVADGGDGTTATILLVDDHFVTVANVGDSSLMMQGPSGELEELTADHRVARNAAEVQRLVAGGATIGRARDHTGKPVGPNRAYPGGLSVTRSIGDGDSSPAIIPEPYIRTLPYPEEGAILLLGSDGVWDFIGEKHIMKLLEASRKPRYGVTWLASAMMKAVRETNMQADDATLVCLDLPPVLPPEAPGALDKGGRKATMFKSLTDSMKKAMRKNSDGEKVKKGSMGSAYTSQSEDGSVNGSLNDSSRKSTKSERGTSATGTPRRSGTPRRTPPLHTLPSK